MTSYEDEVLFLIDIDEDPGCISLILELEVNEEFEMELEVDEEFEMELENPVIINKYGGDPYEGPYTVTPTNEIITLATTGKELEQDLIINPIPSNYGLITWDGSKITVS